MKKLKNQKGITLVALIITIVILLILAVVALREITGDGIIAKAKEARARYETEQGRENTTLADYEDAIEELYSDEMTIDNLLYKAYVGEFESGKKNVAYYLKEKEGKIYIGAKLYDVTTGEDVSSSAAIRPIEVNLTSEFETINITVNGSPIELSSKNAFFDQNSKYMYFTEDAMYIGLTDGKSYTAPCEYIYVRNSSYDSKINN